MHICLLKVDSLQTLQKYHRAKYRPLVRAICKPQSLDSNGTLTDTPDLVQQQTKGLMNKLNNQR